MLWPWHTQRLRQPPAQPDLAPPSGEDLALWRSHCAELLRSPSAFSNLIQITQRISLALQACGMQRVCVMLLDQNSEHAKVSHLHGIQTEQLPHIFSLKKTPLIKHLLKKPMSLLLDTANAARFYPHLPAELTNLFGKTHWLLASVSNSQRVVILIAAD